MCGATQDSELENLKELLNDGDSEAIKLAQDKSLLHWG